MDIKVPPDGGYGWIVVLAYALNNIVVLPLLGNFGLVFQDAMIKTGLSATQGALVIILNNSIESQFSFILAPALSRFGYRKVAVFGAIIISFSLAITAAASSFWIFILSYSILNPFGIAVVMSAFSLAINSFFKDKKSKAESLGMSVTGLGAILMPLLMNALMYAYGWRYTVLTLSALSLHSLVAACLLSPAKWYLKVLNSPKDIIPLIETQVVNGNTDGFTSEEKDDTAELMVDGSENSTLKSLSITADVMLRNAISQSDISPKKQDTVFNVSDDDDHEVTDVKKINIAENFIDKTVRLYGLNLLKDPLLINLLIGLSVAASIETSFNLLLPIILTDMMHFDTSENAYILSIIGFSDTLFRLMAPYIGEWCNMSSRVMHILSLLMIIFVRSVMLSTNTFLGMTLVALAIGMANGIRTTYTKCILPNYVPIEELPYASGIQMSFNGIAIVIVGSLIGQIRDGTNSYEVPIIMLNFLALIPVLLWIGEFLYLQYKRRSGAGEENI